MKYLEVHFENGEVLKIDKVDDNSFHKNSVDKTIEFVSTINGDGYSINTSKVNYTKYWSWDPERGALPPITEDL